ncbi:MAG: DoxX family protein [Bryobacteraceae bacterium]|nr:DoxX family protein [Bryobacteraceae bacterium]
MDKRWIGWLINAPFIAVMLWSIIEKFAETKMIVEAFRGWNLRPYMTSLGAVELAALVLYLVPGTLRIGFFLLCSFLGGAIAVKLQKQSDWWLPAVVLAYLWFAAWYRSRELFTNSQATSNEFRYLS